MPNPASGELYWTAEGAVARITLEGKKRGTFLLSSCRTKEDAAARKQLLADLAARFRRAGVIGTREAAELLKTAAACAPALLPGVLQVAGELVGGELFDKDAPRVPTFAELGKSWTTNELHKLYPDHVKLKDSTLDASRLEKMAAVDVGGIKLGDVPLDSFTLDHAEAAMRKLPEDAKAPATRRQYAQLLHRILALAVYPCRYIKANPLPKGFMPKIGRPPAFPYLYPSEDAALLGWTDDKARAASVDAERPGVPLCYRLLWGFLSREGMREGEASALHVRDFDLELGNVSLDENKTDDARSWALEPGTAAALAAWVEQRGAEPGDRMFVDEHGGPLTPDHRLAELLRAHLAAAGVTRAELHQDGKNRRRMRVHDLRSTFVTLSLANGRTETWVADRTGHRSSQMINRYRRAARSAQELRLGVLASLDDAIPELASKALAAPPAPPLPVRRGAPHSRPSPNDGPSNSGSTGVRTRDQRIKKGTLPSGNQHPSEKQPDPIREQAGEDGAIGPSAGDEHPAESALARALELAAQAGEWATVAELSRELGERRRARTAPAVPSLEAERARRKER